MRIRVLHGTFEPSKNRTRRINLFAGDKLTLMDTLREYISMFIYKLSRGKKLCIYKYSNKNKYMEWFKVL